MSKSDRLSLIRARAAVLAAAKELAETIRADLSVYDTAAPAGWLVVIPAK